MKSRLVFERLRRIENSLGPKPYISPYDFSLASEDFFERYLTWIEAGGSFSDFVDSEASYIETLRISSEQVS